MELHELKAFVMAADLLSINQAAERLRIAQPAMSRKIKKLEAELGVDLFERAHGRIYLTPAGQQFHHDAAVLLRLLADAQNALHRFSNRGARCRSMFGV